MQKKYVGAQLLRCRVIVSREESLRLDRFVATCGSRPSAARRLRVGLGTVEIATAFGGTLLQETYDRLFTALAREERVS